jgi:hypothetical protein
VSRKQFYIFQDKCRRALCLYNPGYVEKQSSPHVFKAKHLADDAERLAGKSGEQKLVIGYGLGRNLSDVTNWQITKVGGIGSSAMFVYVAGKHALRW